MGEDFAALETRMEGDPLIVASGADKRLPAGRIIRRRFPKVPNLIVKQNGPLTTHTLM
jgi:hypothetical protein